MDSTIHNLFIMYLRQGLLVDWLPGQATYTQLINKFNLPEDKHQIFPGYGGPWYQDVHFFFNQNKILTNLELCLTIQEDDVTLPVLLNVPWFSYAHAFTPKTFEDLVVAEQIPCLKATKIGDEEIYPPIYCLDHLGIMPRFQEDPPYRLIQLDMRLLRAFPPLLEYQEIWPKAMSVESRTYLVRSIC